MLSPCWLCLLSTSHSGKPTLMASHMSFLPPYHTIQPPLLNVSCETPSFVSLEESSGFGSAVSIFLSVPHPLPNTMVSAFHLSMVLTVSGTTRCRTVIWNQFSLLQLYKASNLPHVYLSKLLSSFLIWIISLICPYSPSLSSFFPIFTNESSTQLCARQCTFLCLKCNLKGRVISQ